MKTRAFRRFGRSLCTLAAATGFALVGTSSQSHAGPQDPQVVHGAVLFQHNGNFYLIQASNGAVINYSSFDIAAWETVQFQQPNEHARVLNRILGGDPSSINGTLLSNGFVFFANPAGVIFGNNAVVNVGGIYAAAADIDPDVFHNVATLSPNGMGVYPFTDLDGEVHVQAGASIQAVHAAHLLGQRVLNQGTIKVDGDGGIITMTANTGDVMVSEVGGNYLVTIAPGGPPIGGVGVDNAGTVEAVNNGRIMLGAGDMYSMAIRLNGDGIAGNVVDFASDVVLDSDVTIAAEAATFDGAVDSEAGEMHSLTVTDGGLFAHADAVFNGAVGAAVDGQLGHITVGRDVTFNSTLNAAGNVVATAGSAVFNDATDIGGNVEAGIDALFGDDASVGSNVLAGNDVVFGNDASVGGGVEAGGNATFGDSASVGTNVNALSTTFGNLATIGGAVQASGGDAVFGDDAVVGGSVLAQNNVTFAGAADVGNNVIASTGNATFGGNAIVGGNVTAAGNASFGGTADVTGHVHATGGNANFTGAATVGEDVFAANNVFFSGSSNIGGDVTATNGEAVFFGAAEVDGDVTAGQNVNFNSTSDVDGNVTAGTGSASFNGAAVVGGDVLAEQNVTFSSSADVQGGVTATTGNATFAGPAFVGASVIAGNDATFGDDSTVGLGVAAGNDVTFGDNGSVGAGVQAGNDATFGDNMSVIGSVIAGQNIDMGDNGSVSVNVSAGNNVLFGDDGNVGVGVQAGNNATFGNAMTVGGSVSARDVTFGELANVGGTVQAIDGNATFGDAATVGGSVQAKNNVVFTGAANVGNNVTAEDGDAIFGNLDGGLSQVAGNVTAGQNVLFFGTSDVGGNVTASNGDALFTDDAILGGNVTASDDVIFGNDATFDGAGDQMVSAGQMLHANGMLTKSSAGNLTLEGLNEIMLFGDVTVAGGNLNVLNDVLLGSNLGGPFTVSTSGDQTYDGNVLLGADIVMSGVNVDLTQMLTGGGNSLTVNASGQTIFAGIVSGVDELVTDAGGSTTFGDTVAANSVEINDALFLNGGLVATTGNQLYRGGVTLGGGTSLVGANVDVDSALAGGGHDLFVASAGQTRFGGPVTGVGLLTTDAGGTTIFGGSISAGDIEINDALTISGGTVTTSGAQAYNSTVTLGADAALTGDNIDFASTIDGAFGLTATASQTRFGGNVDIDHLAVHGDAVIGTDEIRTRQGQHFDGDVLIDGPDDLSIVSTEGGVRFEGRIDGPRGLTVSAAGDAHFGGNIGEINALDFFETVVEGNIIFDGNLVRAVNNILLNEDVTLAAVPGFATIGATGDIEFVSLDGNFVMGQSQKMSVLGDLIINAQNGSATLSDLNTLGDMTVNANSILLLARPRGPVQFGNVSIIDLGLDFVAGGSFFFSVVPVVINGDLGPLPQFSNPAGDGDALGTLGAFIMRAFSEPIRENMLRGADGSFFDLAVQGPPNTDLSRALAAAAPDESELEEVSDEAQLSAGDIDLLRSISIPVRVLEPQELNDLVEGRGIFLDGSQVQVLAGDAEVAVSRMLTSYVPTVASSYAALLGTTPDSASAIMVQEERTAHIRNTFAQAWSEYQMGSSPGEAAAAEFGAHLQEKAGESENAAEALSFLRGIRRLLADYEAIGLNPAEARRLPMDTVYPRLTPPNMNESDLRQAVESLEYDR